MSQLPIPDSDPFAYFLQYFDQLYSSSSDAVCVTDHKGIVVFINDRYHEMTSIPREAMLGKNVRDMVSNGLFDTVLNMRIVKCGEKVSSIQHLYNGTVLFLDGTPIKNSNGDVAYVVTIARDISILKELHEIIKSQSELLNAFQSLPIDSQGVENGNYPRVLQSPIMQKLYGEAAMLAESDATVLLLGETGTGKDLVAKHIHRLSPRASAPFIKVDCGSIPETLIESELFGYMPGSFSGAHKRGKAGLVEVAHTGTLFLDEIGDLPLPMQSRLLRVLQDWEVVRIGALDPKKVNVRVIAATNKNLEYEIEKGTFRSDLYYRLNVATLRLPPLRKRKADILPLTQVFLAYYNKKFSKKVRLSDDVLQIFQSYHWPGNVRELENLIQRLSLTGKKGLIEARDLQGFQVKVPNKQPALEPDVLPNLDGRTFKSIMKDLECHVLARGLEHFGSIGKMARHFQMDRSTIFRKMRKKR